MSESGTLQSRPTGSGVTSTTAPESSGEQTRAGRLSPSTWIILFGGLFQLLAVVYFSLDFNPAISRLMPDDTFYYLKIAQNIGHGYGSAFSPGEPTNGYHPLWMGVLAALQLLFHPGTKPFVIQVLLLSVAFNVLAAVTLRRLLESLGCSQLGISAGVLFHLLSPWTVNLCLTGLETPLFMFCLYAFFWCTTRLLQDKQAPMRSWVLFGVASGFLMLARTDTVFFTAPTYLYLLATRGVKGLAPLLVSGVLASAILAPWLVWNYLKFGSVLQCSATAMSTVVHGDLPPMTQKAYYRFAFYNAHYTFHRLLFALFLHPRFYYTPDDAWRWINVASVGGVAAAIGYLLLRTRRLHRLPPVIWIAPCVALLAFYFVVRIYVQVWHLAPVLAMVTLALGLAFPKASRYGWPLAATTGVLGLLTAYSLTSCYFYPQQADGLLSRSIHYREDSPRPLKIGHTDTGYLGYFSKHTFVNLDGVVNNQVLKYIEAGRFSEYTAAQHFDELHVSAARTKFYDRNLPAGTAAVGAGGQHR